MATRVSQGTQQQQGQIPQGTSAGLAEGHHPLPGRTETARGDDAPRTPSRPATIITDWASI